MAEDQKPLATVMRANSCTTPKYLWLTPSMRNQMLILLFQQPILRTRFRTTTILGTETMMRETMKSLSTPLPTPSYKSKGKGKGKSKGKSKGGGKKGEKGRSGDWFSQRAPCKFHALGNCTKGRDCPYFHSAFKQRSTGTAAQSEPDEAVAAGAEAKAAAKATRNRKKKNAEE